MREFGEKAGEPPVWASQHLPARAEDARDESSVPGSGRSPGGGRGSPLWCSRLESPRDRGARRAAVHGVAKSRTRLKPSGTSPVQGTLYHITCFSFSTATVLTSHNLFIGLFREI